MSHHPNAGQSHKLIITNKSLGNLAAFKYLQ